jgi:DNA-binding NtrC family response regulator
MENKQIGTIEQMHKRFTVEALKRSNGNRKKAAEMLGISERTLYEKILRYDLPNRNNKNKKGSR